MEFHRTQLDNALTVLAETNPSSASAAVGFFVQAGSRDESPEVLGVSHFLEHMVFKGTQRRSTWDVNREFDEIGADYNAETNKENTCYYAAVLPEFLERTVDILCDILRPSLRQEDFDVEKKVILEEIALYQDQPRSRLYDELTSEHYRGHPLGNLVLGTEASIAGLSRQAMEDYFRQHYVPSNITVVAAGNLDFDGFVRLMAARAASWPAGEPPPRLAPPPPTQTRRRFMRDPRVTRQQVGFISDGPSAQDADRYAAQLAATVLGDYNGSRLYYALIEPAVADDAVTMYMPMDRTGAFLTFFSADNDKAPAALRITQEQLKKFVDEGPTEVELAAAKNKIASGVTLNSEMPMGRMVEVAFEWLYRREYTPLRQQIEMLFDVSVKDVLALAHRWDLTRASLLSLGQAEEL